MNPLPNPFENIPRELRVVPQWVCWRREIRDGKSSKIPYCAVTGKLAAVNKAETWSTFEQAMAAVSSYDGLGFVLTGDIAGFDFDHVLGESGEAEPYVLEIIRHLGDPYTEITPSGRGLRSYVMAPLPPGGNRWTRDHYGIEVYTTKRYFCVTGSKFSGDGIPKLANISLPYFLATRILDEKFKKLWMGDTAEYDGDDSRADLALMSMLARTLNRDAKNMEVAFSASHLGQRDKWIKREDYRRRTIEKALEGNGSAPARTAAFVPPPDAGDHPADVQDVVDGSAEDSGGDTALMAAIRDAALDGELPLFDKRREVARLVREELFARGDFLRTNDGRAFFFHKRERRLYDVDQTPFQHLLTQISGLSATESLFSFALDVLQAFASREARLADVHTFSYFDPDRGLLAISDGTSGVWVRERGGNWQLHNNGDDDLVFITDSQAQAWTPDFSENGHALEWFLRQFMFSDGSLTAEDARTLLLIWVLQQFFPPLRKTRMIPAFLGPQGSGKTSAEKLIGRLLLGSEFDVTGLQRERQDGFTAAVCNRLVVGLDNADSKVHWLPDALATYATGQRYTFRRLYTTNEECSFSPRAILMISSRDPKFHRPDVAERLLPFNFDRPQDYQPEFAIFDELEKRRGAIMGSLLLRAGEIADALPAHPVKALPFRMADFATFGERVSASGGKSSDWIDLLHRLESAQAEFASEGDGLIDALRLLLAEERIIGMPIGELFLKCAKLAESGGFIFPKNCQSFGQRLTNMHRVVEIELGVKFTDVRGHSRRRTVSFTPKDGYAGDAGDAFNQRVQEREGL